ncbi:acyl carrier protein [Streptomyces klenkii]|uniref:acyl carrier protein n=1 Tax=Streptomyces klenkii TaxID=1420899 RepID=UPI00341B3850
MNDERTSPTGPADGLAVLDEVLGMIGAVLGEPVDDFHDGEITRETGLHEDLDMVSIDFADLGGRLAAAYGERVNLAEYFAELDLSRIMYLTVGDIVDYVVSCLHGDAAGAAGRRA